jgi:hypothetical protein
MAGFKGIDAIKGAIDNFATGSNVGFFGLKDDGDRADVQFLHKDADDLNVLLTHQIEVDGKKRYVECLKMYEKPCAMCEQGSKTSLRLFLYLLSWRPDEKGRVPKEPKVELWDRGKDVINRILNLIGKKKDLRKHVYEVVRNGKAGDTGTSYDIDPYDESELLVPIEKLPERPDIYEFVLKKNYDEMVALLKSGAGAASSTPTKRQGATNRFTPIDDDDIPF